MRSVSGRRWMVNRFLALGAAFGRVAASWYFIAPVAVALGLAIGVLVLFFAYPGKPKIGYIDLPFIVITDDSEFIISEFLKYAREDDSIKAVVIKMSSPGGGAASSERLYFATRKLREEKPVVIAMDGMVASGGYMMAMGANHTYAQSASLVGNVGVIALAGSLIPRPLPEVIVTTGPYKLVGASRRDWIGLVDELKDGFAQMVMRERGDRLKITEEELTEGRLYAGVDAVRFGLVDELGGRAEAMEKAAELAGISNYGIVDVNAEVLRQFILRSRRIFASEYDGIFHDPTYASWQLMMQENSGAAKVSPAEPVQVQGDSELHGQMGKFTLINGLEATQEDPLPDFPLEIGNPNIYYLYVGNDY